MTTPRMPNSVSRLWDWTLTRHLVPALLAIGAVIVITGQVGDYRNTQLTTLGAYICVCAGLTVLIGTNGQVSLGHAALMAVGGYTVALVEQDFGNHNVNGQWVLPLALLVATVVTTALGTVVGLAAARLYGPYLAGATLAFGVAIPSIGSQFASVFKGDQGLSFTIDGPPGSFGYSFSFERWQAWYSLFAAIIVLYFLANLHRSAVGRHLRAVRDDEVAARLSGISAGRTRVAAFAISSATAGLGGGVFAVGLQGVAPSDFDLSLSLTLLAAVVIGGLGSLTGAVLGSGLLVVLADVIPGFIGRLHLSAAAAQKLHDNLPLAVYGALLIGVIMLLPGGIQGLLRAVVVRVPRRTIHPTGGKQ
jgi:branched-chain amino acid transport system permease protein